MQENKHSVFNCRLQMPENLDVFREFIDYNFIVISCILSMKREHTLGFP
jgi:hypothetical protein